MIQRIQTLFLIITVILISLMFTDEVVSFITAKGGTYYLCLSGLKMNPASDNILYNTLPLLVLNTIIIALTSFTIFLYKRRILQMRLTIYVILLILGLIGLGIYYVLDLKKKLLIENITFSYTAIFPVIALIFLYLAFRSIRRDEILIRSIDRIR